MGKKFLIDNDILDMEDFHKHHFVNSNNVYEVIRVIDFRILFWDEHFNRLKNSIKLFNYCNVEIEDLLEKVNSIIDINSMKLGNLKIEIIFIENKYKLLIYPIDFFYPSSQIGVRVSTYEIERSNPNIKTYDYDFKSKIQKIINDKKVYEVLLVNKYGFITEGSKSNVYFIKGNYFFTAPDKFVLAGVTRLKVNEIIRDFGFMLREECVSENELFEFEGMFLTSTSSNILPIVDVNGVAINSLSNDNLKSLIFDFEERLKNK